jgi:hypothetical protein
VGKVTVILELAATIAKEVRTGKLSFLLHAQLAAICAFGLGIVLGALWGLKPF